MNNNIKISLTISLEGSTLVRKSEPENIKWVLTKKDLNPLKHFKGKDGIQVVKRGEVNHFPLITKSASQNINMTKESYDYFISSDSCPHNIKLMQWKQMSKRKRLKYHLQETAEFLGGNLLEYEIFEE